MASKWGSWALKTGFRVCFPTDGAGHYLDGAETNQKSSKVDRAFCKGRVHCVGEMPTVRSPEMRVLLWVKVKVAVVLWTTSPDALCP